MAHSSSRANELFNAALERPSHARLEFLRQECGDDKTLLRDVIELLDIHDDIEDLEGPDVTGASPVPPPATGSLTDTIVGDYRLVRLLGRGGMGEVYLACRADGVFQRDVALKMIAAGASCPEDAVRFEVECRTLASLHHPAIAQLHDAGRTPDGRLYFVMEYVDGLPITTYCQRHAVSVVDRIQLLGGVCEAVSYAHRSLVVHRDLKPANILIDADRRPKVIDFGIAKALTRAGLEASDPTLPGAERFTLAYASPEQVRGASAHTGMDVFALGVVLHELVTGVRPHRMAADELTGKGGTFLQPSEVLRRNSTPGTARGPSHGLLADLDAVILGALSGDEKGRYTSVDTFARDLRAIVEHKPLSVRCATRRYRLQKFVRRNPAVVIASSTAAVAIVIAVASLGWLLSTARAERRAATERFEQTRTLASSLFSVDETLGDVAGSTAARQALTSSLSRYLASLRVRAGDDAHLLLDVAESYRRLGDVQGNPNRANLGDTAGALASYDASMEILASLAARSTADPSIIFARAETLGSAADVFSRLGQHNDAEARYLEALALTADLQRGDALEPRSSALEGRLRRALGDVNVARNALDAAAAEFDRALSIERTVTSRVGDSDERRRLLAVTRLRIAEVKQKQGAWGEAREQYEAAVEVLSAISQSGSHRAALLRDTAVGLTHLAAATEVDDEAASAAHLETALGLLRQLHAADQADARVRLDLLRALLQYGDLVRARSVALAQQAYREARLVAEGLHQTPMAPDVSPEFAVLQARLRSGGAPVGPDLQLFSVDGRQRVLLKASENVPPTVTRVAVSARVPPGLVAYLIVFGARGTATLLDQTELKRLEWSLPVSGPPPAQTILLLALPRRLSEAERTGLVQAISAVPGPRAVDFDSQVVWSSGENHRILSTASSRGLGTPAWINTIRSRLSSIDGAQYAGRTFPIPERRPL